MKILHSSDWHIGTFKGPEMNGVNLRSLDTKDCLDCMVTKAEQERPELSLVSGDIFHAGKTWSDRCCYEVIAAIDVISRLAKVSKHVIIIRGTPNHDGDGPFKVLQKHFLMFENVHIAVEPKIIHTEYADIAVVPGFEQGIFRAKFPGLGKEEENEVFTKEIGNIVMGLKAQCSTEKPAILMAHYTVPGSNTESGQSHLLTQFEPILTVESLKAANYDLVALGHIHRPQAVSTVDNAFYAGSINANNFNDEGQERGFWIHEIDPDLPFDNIKGEFIKTPYREHITFHFTDTDITAIVQGNIDEVAMNYWRYNGAVAGKIVRVFYGCSVEKHKAFNTALLEKTFYEDGAFYVSGITPKKIEPSADKNDLSQETDPEANLRMYLEENHFEPEVIERLILKARPIIEEAIAGDTAVAFSGMFIPLEIEVNNYRTYKEEKFNFEEIQFCTINGVNGAGKSSLFMDAIIDCIFEEPREGGLKDNNNRAYWLRNDEKVKSGYIMFTFSIGNKVYRVYRNRTRSGSITLNLSERINGEWEDCSCGKSNDTQEVILKLIGVDSLTFKSCALIMQDQYGLFLQAKKEERMTVLSNLLGLGIYGVMEGIARDKAAEHNRIIKNKEQNIKVQIENIQSAGKPEEELEEVENELKELEQGISKKTLEKENANIQFSSKKGAEERRRKLIDSINILTEKKSTAEQNRSNEKDIIIDCNGILADELEITEKAEQYRQLIEKEKSLIEGSTLYDTKIKELKSVNMEINATENELTGYKTKFSNEQKRLVALKGNEDQEEIKYKAAEYTEKKQQLDDLYVVSQNYTALTEKRSREAYSYDSKKALYNEKERELLKEQASLNKRTELLDNSGCVDIEKANCRFLVDAVEAKAELSTYPEKIENLRNESKSVLEELRHNVDDIETKIKELNFNPEDLETLRKECEQLKTLSQIY